jgi:hypothetical protein
MTCDGCGKAAAHVRFVTRGIWVGRWHCRECWTAPHPTGIRFGREEEWQDFERRHLRFVARFEELQGIINAVVSRDVESADPADRLIFFLGRQAVEDFLEIFLNVGNGYGVAGLKLLRPMFERVIHPKSRVDRGIETAVLRRLRQAWVGAPPLRENDDLHSTAQEIAKQCPAGLAS